MRSEADEGVHRADEGLSHSIGLRTFDGCRPRFWAYLANESARIASNVAATVAGESFDGRRQVRYPAEAMLDSRHHQVPHVVTGDAACSGEEAHGSRVTKAQCEGDPHSLAVVAADLEARTRCVHRPQYGRYAGARHHRHDDRAKGHGPSSLGRFACD
jgi:hypothetical protein